MECGFQDCISCRLFLLPFLTLLFSCFLGIGCLFKSQSQIFIICSTLRELLWSECLHPLFPKLIWNSKTYSDGIRRRSPYRGWLGHNSRVPMNGIGALMKETRGSSVIPSTVWRHNRKIVIYELGSGNSQTPICQDLGLRDLNLQNCDKFCCL
jgi:hypothetical protein